MNEVIGAGAALAFGSLTLTSFFLVVGALFPNRVARTRTMADGSPGRAFGVGLINLIFFSALAALFFALAENTRLEFLALPGLMLLALLVVGLTFGLTAMAQLVGDRLAPTQPTTLRSIGGALTLCLGCAVPVAGWFALLPYAVLVGLGAFVLGFLYAARPAESAPATQRAAGV